MNSADTTQVTSRGNAPKGALLARAAGAEMLTYSKGEQDSSYCRTAIMATYLPFSDVVAAYGYRQPVARQHSNLMMLALAYTVMGGALGTVAGTGLAMATSQTSLPKMSFQVAQTVEASAASYHATPTPTVGAPTVASAPMSPAVAIQKPSPVKLAKSHLELPAHRVAVVRTALTTKPQVRFAAPAISANPIATFKQAALPAALSTHAAAHAAAASAAPAPAATAYKFFSEGDVTVADFDATTGTIESYEGRTFVLNSTTVTLAGAALEDSGSSVHYRCDQSGSCTLMRAGLVMQNVRLE